MNAAEREVRSACGSVSEEGRDLAAMVKDYQALIVPRSFQYWLESIAIDEAERMKERFHRMVDAELARQGDGDRDGATADVLFRIGWALGAASAEMELLPMPAGPTSRRKR